MMKQSVQGKKSGKDKTRLDKTRLRVLAARNGGRRRRRHFIFVLSVP
jgi:hypothetical protein